MVEEKNPEIFTLVCLGILVEDTDKYINIQQQLRALVNRLKLFQRSDDCEQYIRSVTKEDRIILIVSGELSSKIVPYVYQLRQVVIIYVYDKNQRQTHEVEPEKSKVKYVIGELDDLVAQLASDQGKRDITVAVEPLSLTIFNLNNNPDRSTTELNGQFVHAQLLLDCLTQMKSFFFDKSELISLIRKEYEKNIHGLVILQEFEESYSCDKAIWWYTRASFLYQTLNKALRAQNIELLLLFRFFIRDIQLQLEAHQCPSQIRVYRGQLISNEELGILKNSIGHFISINSFWSTSVKRDVAHCFVDGFLSSADTYPILFEIDADPQLANIKPFANITSLSYFPSEEEVLFMPGSIYRLVELVHEDSLWILRMNLCNDKDDELHSVLEYMKNQYGDGERNLFTFGVVLYNMGKFTEAENCYHRILADESYDDHLISTCYHALGTIALEQGNYDLSLEWNHKLLQICIRKQERDKSVFAHCYNSMGVAYQKKGEYQRTLHSYRTAVVLWKKIFDENHPKVAMSLNNLGSVYHALENYSKALECFCQALAIWEIHLPANCSDLGAAHNNIGCIYGCLDHFEDAMKHFNLSLKIYQKSLPPKHAANAKTLENMGLVHYLRGELSDALYCYQKSAAIYHHALPSTHPKLIKIKKDIQSILEKKTPSTFHLWWLDNLQMPHTFTMKS